MELICLNSSFEMIHIVDDFKTLIWTDRFWSAGDLDFTMFPSSKILDILDDTVYFKLDDSDHKMILETVNIKSDIEDGDLLIVKGSSLESILNRRIIWFSKTLSGNLQTNITSLIDENIINPTDSDRDINLDVIASTDPGITALTIDTQFLGETIYEAIRDICQAKGIGFRIDYDDSLDLFRFKLIAGVDRSYAQTDTPYIAFTEDLNNLINADYVESSKVLKTVALVSGEEGIGNFRTTVTVPAPGGALTGLNRREMYVEASITRNGPDGELTDEEYLDQLAGKGVEELAKNIFIEAFDGEVDTTQYAYGSDFFMGDILQIADKYGHSTKSRVVEMIFSQDAAGIKKYPTFETVE